MKREWDMHSMMKGFVVTGAALFAVIVPSSAQAQSQSRLCDVDQVGVFENRIHIKCVPIADKAYTKDIPYYAMRIDKPKAVVDGIIALAVGAKQTRKPLRIWFDFGDYKSVPGCQGNDCRRLVAAALE